MHASIIGTTNLTNDPHYGRHKARAEHPIPLLRPHCQWQPYRNSATSICISGTLITFQIDWDPVCAALELEKVAVTKRWSRLKLSINKGEKPDASNEQLLWLMVKHSERKKVGSPTSCFLPPHRRHSQGFDWVAIAEKCGSTKGAVSKRYSRMKLAFERGDEPPPSTPTKGNKAAATPKKTPSKAQFKTQDDEDGTPTTTSKRKRTPAKKKACSAEAADDEDEQDDKPKRVKSTPKARPRPKNAFRASDENRASEEPRTVVKGEPVESDGDVFMDAPEQASAEADAKGDIDEICKCIIHSLSLTVLALLPLVETGADTLSAHFGLLRAVCSSKGVS